MLFLNYLSLHLLTEKGEHIKPKTPIDNRVCKNCNAIEDEKHFVLYCSLYHNECTILFTKLLDYQNIICDQPEADMGLNTIVTEIIDYGYNYIVTIIVIVIEISWIGVIVIVIIIVIPVMYVIVIVIDLIDPGVGLGLDCLGVRVSLASRDTDTRYLIQNRLLVLKIHFNSLAQLIPNKWTAIASPVKLKTHSNL